MSMTEVWMPSPNYSTGRGPYNKVVLHTTEGAQSIEALGSFFSQSSAGVSSHFGADNHQRGVVGAYVYESNKAWTQGNANPYCLSLEMCTPSGAASGWSRDYWLKNQDTLLRNAADWVAWMCAKYGIPLTALSASQAQNADVRGVCQHMNLGSWGGNHSDCGNGFPMDQVMEWAKSGSGGGSPSQPQPQEDGFMTASTAIDPEGKLHMACIGAGDGAVFYRAPNDVDWRRVDNAQRGAKSGADITVGPAGELVITYVNGSGHVSTYHKGVDDDGWIWTDRGGQAR